MAKINTAALSLVPLTTLLRSKLASTSQSVCLSLYVCVCDLSCLGHFLNAVCYYYFSTINNVACVGRPYPKLSQLPPHSSASKQTGCEVILADRQTDMLLMDKEQVVMNIYLVLAAHHLQIRLVCTRGES